MLYKDNSFPKDALGGPSQNILNRMHYTKGVLDRRYKGSGKESLQEKFRQNVIEASALLSMTLLKGLVNNLKEELPEVLTTLEILFDGNQREKNGYFSARG